MLEVREEHIDRITEVFHLILNGRIPKLVELPEDYPENEVKQVVEYVNKFVVEYLAFADILSTLSKGELDLDPPKSKIFMPTFAISLGRPSRSQMAISPRRWTSWATFPRRSTA